MDPVALRVLSNIAAKALSLLEGARAGSRTARAVPDRSRLLPLDVAAATAASAFALSLMIRSGQAWSSALPAASAILAVSVVGCVAARDLLPRRQAAAVRQVSAPITDPLDQLPGLITRHDAAGGVISAHGADRRTFGFAATHADGTAFIDQIHLGGRIAWLSAIDELRQGARRTTTDLLFAVRSIDGGYRPVRIEMSADYAADGSFAGFLAQTRDRSEESALKGEANAWNLQARAANDAKTRFLAAVSHELRTPLNAILGFSDILKGEYFGRLENDRQREYVDLINQSGHHLLAVVNTMLDMSKIEAGRYDLVKEPFQIADAIRTVDEMLGLQARTKGVVLTARVARGLEEVVADRRAVQQVLINLAGNAIKFTAEGGVVAIDAVAEGRLLKIAVSDTGIGIPADRLASIGQPFMQVQNDYTRRYDGTGLGLALVKGLVALHGGTFAIESEEGAGTVITVTLPLDGQDDNGGETVEFPPRLRDKGIELETGENRHGSVQAKIA
ncbi:two-component sensor histidine kinase [Rhizobium sp. KVB221]|uniref:histidine kinase n=2 Tax=Rhizobium setariae TaxID=2801340 RepID=A0A936YR28_9HYPH|nr:two-component sensor histidine kinase [Rhizobium setariae]